MIQQIFVSVPVMARVLIYAWGTQQKQTESLPLWMQKGWLRRGHLKGDVNGIGIKQEYVGHEYPKGGIAHEKVLRQEVLEHLGIAMRLVGEEWGRGNLLQIQPEMDSHADQPG